VHSDIGNSRYWSCAVDSFYHVRLNFGQLVLILLQGWFFGNKFLYDRRDKSLMDFWERNKVRWSTAILLRVPHSEQYFTALLSQLRSLEEEFKRKKEKQWQNNHYMWGWWRCMSMVLTTAYVQIRIGNTIQKWAFYTVYIYYVFENAVYFSGG